MALENERQGGKFSQAELGAPADNEHRLCPQTVKAGGPNALSMKCVLQTEKGIFTIPAQCHLYHGPASTAFPIFSFQDGVPAGMILCPQNHYVVIRSFYFQSKDHQIKGSLP